MSEAALWGAKVGFVLGCLIPFAPTIKKMEADGAHWAKWVAVYTPGAVAAFLCWGPSW